jgi:PadR family transcriptional regulator PadR
MEPGPAHHGETRTDAALDRLRRGALEYCVLTLLRGGRAYSYDVVRALASVDGLVTSEGTVYPLLSRLRREGLVQTQWQESPQGPPRRYYELTPEGDATVDAFAAAWQIFRPGVDSIVADGVRAAGGGSTDNSSAARSGPAILTTTIEETP